VTLFLSYRSCPTWHYLNTPSQQYDLPRALRSRALACRPRCTVVTRVCE
jgi:hypothetical protein